MVTVFRKIKIVKQLPSWGLLPIMSNLISLIEAWKASCWQPFTILFLRSLFFTISYFYESSWKKLHPVEVSSWLPQLTWSGEVDQHRYNHFGYIWGRVDMSIESPASLNIAVVIFLVWDMPGGQTLEKAHRISFFVFSFFI